MDFEIIGDITDIETIAVGSSIHEIARLRKIYQVIADVRADQHQLVRVIDESGEDYLYSEDYFVTIKLPRAVEEVFALSA